ncbi:MAG: hypothetical protein LBB36_04525 [Fibromonadaceae bacterium]|jgi:hypothetical protein|nr:hypothetical protein [Fibromonadaceae bacterium]
MYGIKFKFIWLLLLGVQAVNAANVLAVLEIVPKANVDEISIDELRHLTDELRKQATTVLPTSGYTVLTRDNIIALIPPDEKEADCLAESCAVEIGRAIGAEFISQGSIGIFSGEYSLSIELYESMGGKLLGSIVMESPDVKGLLAAIREHSPALFSKIKPPEKPPEPLPEPLSEPGLSGLKDLQDYKSSESLNQVNQGSGNKGVRASAIVAISLDVLGAAAIGFGIYQNFQKEKHHREYKDMLKNPDKNKAKEYDSQLKKANDAKKFSEASLILGSALLASGIAVHIWF